jgi:hypothetical protein
MRMFPKGHLILYADIELFHGDGHFLSVLLGYPSNRYCPYGYERHSETVTIPPGHVALRCDSRLPIWEQQRVTHVHPAL